MHLAPNWLALSSHALDCTMASKKYVVYVVCVSNSCLSPLVEYLLKRKVSAVPSLKGAVEIKSRVVTLTYEASERPPSIENLDALKTDFGIDMSIHRSMVLTQQDLDEADYIIPAGRDVGSYLRQVFKLTSANKILYLVNDLPDLQKQPVDSYRKCVASIDSMLGSVVETLYKRSESEVYQCLYHYSF